jgi:hypothetical protein
MLKHLWLRIPRLDACCSPTKKPWDHTKSIEPGQPIVTGGLQQLVSPSEDHHTTLTETIADGVNGIKKEMNKITGIYEHAEDESEFDELAPDWVLPCLKQYEAHIASLEQKLPPMVLTRIFGTLYASSEHRPVPYKGTTTLTKQQDLPFVGDWALIKLLPILDINRLTGNVPFNKSIHFLLNNVDIDHYCALDFTKSWNVAKKGKTSG